MNTKSLKVFLLITLLSVGQTNCIHTVITNNTFKYAAIIALMIAGIYGAKDLEGLDVDLGAWK